ncbi:MAG: CRISPR-associated ring nuclease [Candidatus Nezhaarchaeota archaeon]|nr:CRISPR-associated ring nuclease [Candidatus Nezhaarchaeota archaeon]
MLVLIASLGLSPGVVTGTVDALIDEGERPGRVYVATTGHPDIMSKCIPLLIQEFGAYPYPIELRYKEVCTERDDIYDEKDNAEFMRKVAAVLSREVKAGNEVYLSLAGGRKTMSAAMALLGQLYGAKYVLHLLIDPELEAKGLIDRLLGLSEEERGKVLHPPSDKRRLVRFPVFATPWRIYQVMEALRKGRSRNKKLNETVGKLPENVRRLLLKVLEDAEKLATASPQM